MQRKSTITVTQLTLTIKNQLESNFSHLVVEGEISNCKLHSSGHLYFDLKDAQAKISAVLFNAHLEKVPKEGDQVIVYGSVTVYPPHGKYQILVQKLEYKGVGELLLKLEQLKKKLQQLGWFDQEKKKALPKFPKRIGVITSPTGAVIRDIIQILSRRVKGFHLILSPVRVQGEGAAAEIAQAIEQMNRYQLVDVIIAGRGGGSLEDLWPFNEEIMAKAIFESRIPIVSAVGHETDWTISDLVADIRAPTPSAAAEIVTSEQRHHLDFLAKLNTALAHTLSHQVRRYRSELNGFLRHPCLSTSYALLAGHLQNLDEIKTRLDEKMVDLVQKRGERIKDMTQQLQALDPKNVLKRGYSILLAGIENSVIVSTSEFTPGDEIRAILSDGEARLHVKS